MCYNHKSNQWIVQGLSLISDAVMFVFGGIHVIIGVENNHDE